MLGLNEKTIGSREVFSGKIIRVRVDRVQLPNGKETMREIVEHSGAVAVVPVTEDGRVVLVRQFRKPVEKVLLEIPAGLLEKGEPPDLCALRELEEETGYRPGKLEKLCEFYTSPGFSDEKLYLYFAGELEEGEGTADSEEILEIFHLSLEDAVALIRTGEIEDAKTIIGLLTVFGGRKKGDGIF